MAYITRLLDAELDALMPDLAAIAIDGAKGVGKTETARRRAATTVSLDQANQMAVTRGDVHGLLSRKRPLFIDEWQLLPEVWDLIRRAVDDDRSGGQFLLAGSAAPSRSIRIHSGAGRIVSFHMRPMALCERGVSEPSVSMAALLADEVSPVSGTCELALTDYIREILASGMPGIRTLPGRARAVELRSYLDRAVDRDLPEAGLEVRRPQALRAWLTAYAAATATTASYNTILDAATAGESDKPKRQTVSSYREALQRMWLLDPLGAWWPTMSPLKRLAQAPKHHLADPALAGALLGTTETSLMHDASLLGALFESLATLTVRAIAAAQESRVYHLRTRNGDHEIDLIVERPDHRVVAIEVKLTDIVTDRDVRHLNWLHTQLGERVVDRVIITTGEFAYRRRDGVAVVPLALLGP